MKFVVISDTHGDHRQMTVPAGDTIIHAGDMTANGRIGEVQDFIQWFDGLAFDHKLLVAGNHDWYLESDAAAFSELIESTSIHYLNDTGVVLDGIRFWGSPVTPEFFDWAFQCKPGSDIDRHWQLIPPLVDILITHGPPFGVMDQVPQESNKDPAAENVTMDCVSVNAGCRSLLERVREVAPIFHIFGHIHEGYGQQTQDNVRFINAASMNAQYRLCNPAVEFEFELPVS